MASYGRVQSRTAVWLVQDLMRHKKFVNLIVTLLFDEYKYIPAKKMTKYAKQLNIAESDCN